MESHNPVTVTLTTALTVRITAAVTVKSDSSRDTSSEYVPAAKQRKRRYHDFTSHPTVSTELEGMEDFFCSPNNLARGGGCSQLRDVEKDEHDDTSSPFPYICTR